MIPLTEDQEKREIVERVARNVRDFGYFDGTLDITEEVLDAGNYFKLIDLLDSVERWHMCVGVYQCEDAWEDVLSALKAALKGGEGD